MISKNFSEGVGGEACMKKIIELTSGSRGGAPGARPPNGRGPMIF